MGHQEQDEEGVMKGDFYKAPKWAMHLAIAGRFKLRYWIEDPSVGARMMATDGSRWQGVMNDFHVETCEIIASRAGILKK